MTLNEFMNHGRDDRTKQIAGMTLMDKTPTLLCADGFRISVQASEYHYCEPRVSLADATGYESFELGYPSELDSLIEPFAEDEGTTQTVFPFTPREIVEALIEKHGGIV